MFTNLLMKWFGPSFIIKQRSTFIVFIGSLFRYLPMPIPDELKSNITGGLADLIVLILSYIIATKLDTKPITKSEIIKIEESKK